MSIALWAWKAAVPKMSGSDALPLITKVRLISQEVEEKEGQESFFFFFFFVFLFLFSLVNKYPPTPTSQCLHHLQHLFISFPFFCHFYMIPVLPPSPALSPSLTHLSPSVFALSLGRPATGSVGQDLGISSIPLSTPPRDCTLFLSPTYPSPLHKSCRTQSLSHKCRWRAYTPQDRKT